MSIPATIISEENEITIYCQISDFKGLDQAVRVLHQEQYEIKSPTGNGKIRVRAESDGENAVTYSLTTKVKSTEENVVSNTEYTTIIDREYFDAFKAIAGKGQTKKRYLFPIKNVNVDGDGVDITRLESYYEVDIFSSLNGSRYVWCKIDLELDSLLEVTDKTLTKNVEKVKIIAKVTGLPFKPTDVFMEETATDIQKDFIKYLYEVWNSN
jgi:hypothetical protein